MGPPKSGQLLMRMEERKEQVLGQWRNKTRGQSYVLILGLSPLASYEFCAEHGSCAPSAQMSSPLFLSEYFISFPSLATALIVLRVSSALQILLEFTDCKINIFFTY